ncbi:15626_t:CDS:2 [Dentiscutata erythropus]|uniref:15626_t:CDS:1 n=1 Tax=Dentiscutata erythropus TaxID=1348616 RepID=A0A9N9BKS3_9GLOM|nr:15626_t:CDS:2 [Dentiscutata erythropus]
MFKVVFQNTPKKIPNLNEYNICIICMFEISLTPQSPIIASESEYFCSTCQDINLRKTLEQKDFIKNINKQVNSIEPTTVNTLIEYTPILFITIANSINSNDPAISTVTNTNSNAIFSSPASVTFTITDFKNLAMPTVTNSSKSTKPAKPAKSTKPIALFNSSSFSGSDEALKKERIFLEIFVELITLNKEMSRVSSSEEETIACQAEILSWYQYAKEFENQLNKELQNNKTTMNKAKSKVYNEIILH